MNHLEKMIRIIKIEQQTGNKRRYLITFNSHYSVEVSEDILVKFRLNPGKKLDDNLLEEVILAEEQGKANAYALRLLSCRERSEYEITQKMKEKGYANPIVENTMNFLKQNQYVDDKQFAAAFVENRLNKKNRGRTLIKQELYSKGVSKEIIQRTLVEHMDSDQEYAVAMEISEKKLKTSFKDYNKKEQYQKLGLFLQRKGFSYETISKILNKLVK